MTSKHEEQRPIAEEVALRLARRAYQAGSMDQRLGQLRGFARVDAWLREELQSEVAARPAPGDPGYDLKAPICGAEETVGDEEGPCCTLDPGHEGEHEARDIFDQVVARWPAPSPETVTAELRGLMAECLALNPTVSGDMEKVRVWADVVKRMKAAAGGLPQEVAGQVEVDRGE